MPPLSLPRESQPYQACSPWPRHSMGIIRDAFMLLSVDTLRQVTWEVDSCPRVPVTMDGGGSRSRTEDISSYRPRAGMRG